MARSVVAQIKRDMINALRDTTTGYGTIAQRPGLTKARVQQIANTPRPPGLAAAFALQDEHGDWHGEPGLLAPVQYREAPSFIPFSPADKCNPLAGQVLTVRYGCVDEKHGISAYTLQIRQDDGSALNLRMTRAMQDALFGPPGLGTPNGSDGTLPGNCASAKSATRTDHAALTTSGIDNDRYPYTG